MLVAGFTFLNGAAVNVAMLIVGRILLGFGVGFTNQPVQSVPIYLSEMAPPRPRGAVNIGFQLFIGIWVLSVIRIKSILGGGVFPWGWQASERWVPLPFPILPAVRSKEGRWRRPGPCCRGSAGIDRGYRDFQEVILGVMNLSSIIISILVVEKYGRRALFLEGRGCSSGLHNYHLLGFGSFSMYKAKSIAKCYRRACKPEVSI